MRFLGVFSDGRFAAVIPGDDDAERLVQRWPDIAQLVCFRANARVLGLGVGTDARRDNAARPFDGRHVVAVTDHAIEVMRELFARDPARAGFIEHQRDMAREALRQNLLGAARGALRVLVPEDYRDATTAGLLLDTLRRRALDEPRLRTAVIALVEMETVDCIPPRSPSGA